MSRWHQQLVKRHRAVRARTAEVLRLLELLERPAQSSSFDMTHAQAEAQARKALDDVWLLTFGTKPTEQERFEFGQRVLHEQAWGGRWK